MDITKKAKVTYLDGRDPTTTKATPRGQVVAERHFGCSVVAMNNAEHVYYIIWASLKFAGKESNDFEAFLDSVDDIEFDKTDKSADASEDPTVEAPSPDSSSS